MLLPHERRQLGEVGRDVLAHQLLRTPGVRIRHAPDMALAPPEISIVCPNDPDAIKQVQYALTLVGYQYGVAHSEKQPSIQQIRTPSASVPSGQLGPGSVTVTGRAQRSLMPSALQSLTHTPPPMLQQQLRLTEKLYEQYPGLNPQSTAPAPEQIEWTVRWSDVDVAQDVLHLHGYGKNTLPGQNPNSIIVTPVPEKPWLVTLSATPSETAV